MSTPRALQDDRQTLDGVLVIDKPAGLTSHDVVAAVRRITGTQAIGHTGTLDPFATGVLALVVGRATRLSRFLTAEDKAYDAVIHLGVSTDTYDATGTEIARWNGPMPDASRVREAARRFVGAIVQTPPPFSAKKVGGVPAHTLARRGAQVDLAPAQVSAEQIEVAACDGATVTLRIVCSKGFYVRSLAHDLGLALGVGAHVSALRRTRSGDFTIDASTTLEALQARPDAAPDHLRAMNSLLPGIPEARLTVDGVDRARHGAMLLPQHWAGDALPEGLFRLVDDSGALIGLGERRPGAAALHPSIVLR